MKMNRLEHIDIVCENLQESVEFYRKLGLAPEGTIDDGTTVFMFNGDSDSPVRVELHQKQEGQKTGVDHIALQVADTDDAYQEGKYLGIEFLFEPLQNMQSGRRIVNMLDPDGVQIQFARSTRRGEYKDWG
jgi:catechol 2,3-dioxygenase-like lactoylglutathione lyase family enzyme